jgi:beta-lactamase class A
MRLQPLSGRWVQALDCTFATVDSGELLTHSADVRFPLNSTFKLFACAALLKRVEVGTSSLDDQVPIGRQQLVSWSPVVERMLDEDRSQMSTDELCAATLSVSDNTAANLILGEIGGPLGFTSYMRGLGDQVTRLDRCEPELNEGLADDPRDTTTPRAIGKSIEKLLLGNQLMPSSRVKLQGWLEGHRMAGRSFSIRPARKLVDLRSLWCRGEMAQEGSFLLSTALREDPLLL